MGLREYRRKRDFRKTPEPEGGAESAVAGVRLTHPDRVLYPADGITKRDLAVYYESIAGHVLPHVVGRPLTLVRCPDGHTRGCFYQKHATGTIPVGISRTRIREESGWGTYLVIEDLRGLIGLVQMGVLEVHTWGSPAKDLEHPDRMIFDLDPGPEVSWSVVVETARLLRDRLSKRGLPSFVKTTGGKGLHIVVPLQGTDGWPEVKAFSREVAEGLERDFPERYTSQASKAKRRGRIFIDYLRNVRGATAVAAYSTRARAGAPVSVPLGWDELTDALRSDAFNVRNLSSRLARMKGDPWKRLEVSRVGLMISSSSNRSRLRRSPRRGSNRSGTSR